MCARKVWSGRSGEHCEAAQLTVGSGPPVPGASWPPVPVDMFTYMYVGGAMKSVFIKDEYISSKSAHALPLSILYFFRSIHYMYFLDQFTVFGNPFVVRVFSPFITRNPFYHKSPAHAHRLQNYYETFNFMFTSKKNIKGNKTQRCVYMCVCMYVHTCYVLTKPPIPPSSCDHIRNLRPNFFLHNERANPRVPPL
jgi:hypothetical protein